MDMSPIFTVLKDYRENPNEIIITTKDKEIALAHAIQYLRENNVGEFELLWKTDEDFDIEVMNLGNQKFVDKYNSMWLVSPTLVVHRLEEEVEY